MRVTTATKHWFLEMWAWNYIYIDRLYSASQVHIYLADTPIRRHWPTKLYRHRVELEPWPLELCLWPRRWSNDLVGKVFGDE